MSAHRTRRRQYWPPPSGARAAASRAAACSMSETQPTLLVHCWQGPARVEWRQAGCTRARTDRPISANQPPVLCLRTVLTLAYADLRWLCTRAIRWLYAGWLCAGSARAIRRLCAGSARALRGLCAGSARAGHGGRALDIRPLPANVRREHEVVESPERAVGRWPWW